MAGYSVAETLEEADAVFMNTCSIRDNAEQKILNRLEFFHSLKKKEKHLIVGVLGCMAERGEGRSDNESSRRPVVGPDAYLTLPDLIAARSRREGDQCGTFHYRNLSGCDSVGVSAATIFPDSCPSCAVATTSVPTRIVPYTAGASVAVM